MLTLKEEYSYTVSARHYLHQCKYVVEESVKRFGDALNTVKEFEQTCPSLTDSVRTAVQRDIDALKTMKDDVAQALRPENFERHASTVAGHKKYIEGWSGKISAALMRVVGCARSLGAVADDVCSALTVESIADYNGSLPAGEVEFLMKESTSALALANELLDIREDRMNAALSPLSRVDEFMNADLTRRSSKFEELCEHSFPTLSKIASVIKVQHEYGSLNALRRMCNNSASQAATKAVHAFFDRREEFDDASAMHDRALVFVKHDVELALSYIKAAVQAEYASAVTRAVDGDAGEIGHFMNTVVKIACDKAFTMVDKRSSAITGVRSAVTQAIEDISPELAAAYDAAS